MSAAKTFGGVYSVSLNPANRIKPIGVIYTYLNGRLYMDVRDAGENTAGSKPHQLPGRF